MIIRAEGTAAEAQQTVDHPDYYKAGSGIECIDVMQDAFGREKLMDFCLISAFKYLYRCEKKQATPVEDIRKADWYLQKWLELEEKK